MKNWPYIFSLTLIFSFFLACSTGEKQPEEEATIEKESPPLPVIEEFPLDSSAYEWVDGYLLLSWSVLAKVDFELRMDKDVGTEISFPIFSDDVKALQGKPVQIKGYVIPLEETGGEAFLILSAFPYSQCFFCGNAGPESVIDVLAKDDVGHLRTDEQLTFRGKLKVNDTDLNFLNYILQDAEIVEE